MGYSAQEAEWLMATYGFSLDHAVWGHPRAATLVLMPVYYERMGYTGMAGYTDLASARARKEVMRWIHAHYEVVAASPAEVGWRLGDAPAFLLKASEREDASSIDCKEPTVL